MNCMAQYNFEHTHPDPYRGKVGQGNHPSLSLASLLARVAWLPGSAPAQWAPHCSCAETWDVASLSWCCPQEPSCQTWNWPCWVWTCHCSVSVQLQKVNTNITEGRNPKHGMKWICFTQTCVQSQVFNICASWTPWSLMSGSSLTLQSHDPSVSSTETGYSLLWTR